MTYLLKGRGKSLLSAFSSKPSFGVCEVVGSALLYQAIETPISSDIPKGIDHYRKKGVVIGLLIETYEANNFPQENNLKVKGNPNQNSRSSVEKCIRREGGNAAPELLWGPVDSIQVSPGPACLPDPHLPDDRLCHSLPTEDLETGLKNSKVSVFL